MPYVERYEIEVMPDRTTVLHDNLTGHVIMSSSGFHGFMDCVAEKQKRDAALADELLWDWMKD